MWNIVTLDGFFEGAKSWDLPWRKRIWGEELEQFSIEQLWRYPSVSAGKDRMTICCGRELQVTPDSVLGGVKETWRSPAIFKKSACFSITAPT